MKFAAVHRSYTQTRPYLGSTAAARGAWLSVLVHASDVDSDRLVAARTWSDREWLAIAAVDRKDLEAAVAAGLLRWDGDDLIVDGFDHAGLEAVNRRRAGGALGAAHGSRGGRPRKNPSATPQVSDPEPLGIPLRGYSENPSKTPEGFRSNSPQKNPSKPLTREREGKERRGSESKEGEVSGRASPPPASTPGIHEGGGNGAAARPTLLAPAPTDDLV